MGGNAACRMIGGISARGQNVIGAGSQQIGVVVTGSSRDDDMASVTQASQCPDQATIQRWIAQPGDPAAVRFPD
jgi:hypothetical protein